MSKIEFHSHNDVTTFEFPIVFKEKGLVVDVNISLVDV